MSQRLLQQFDWSGGQTDGDPTKTSVSRLLNVELDSPGKLKPRGRLDQRQAVPGIYSRHVRITGDPTEQGLSHWDAYLSPYGIMLTSGQDVTTLGFDSIFSLAVDTEKTSMRPIQDGLIMSVWLHGGLYGGLFNVVATKNITTGLPAPTYLVGTPWALPGNSQSARWVFSQVNGVTPIIAAVNISLGQDIGLLGEFTDGQLPQHPTDEHGDPESALYGMRLFSLYDAIGPDRTRIAVGCSIFHSPGNGAYGRTASVELIAQFVFNDGTTSMSSAPVVVSLIGDSEGPEDDWAIGYMLACSAQINPSISRIRVYRKIVNSGNDELEPDNEHSLVIDAPTNADGLEDFNVDFGNTEMIVQRENSDINGQALMLYEGDTTFADYDYDSEMAIPSFKYVRDGATIKTAGWIAAYMGNASVAIFMPPHFMTNGKCYVEYTRLLWAYGPIKWGYYGRFIHGGVTSQIGQVSICGGMPLGFLLNERWDTGSSTWIRKAPGYLSFGNLSGSALANYFPQAACISLEQSPINASHPHSFLFYLGASDISNHADNQSLDRWQSNMGNVGTSPANDPVYDVSVPLLVNDYGVGTVMTLEAEAGAQVDEFVQPEIASVIKLGGRIFGLNVKYDGKSWPSRLLYTQPGSSIFSKSRMIDYAGVNEGAGFAIAHFKSTLALFYSDSIYLLDMSGGADFNWRQVGAVVASPAFSQYAVCTTQSGIAWAGTDIMGIVGNQTVNLSAIEERGISIKKSYHQAIADNPSSTVRTHYCDVRNQLWVTIANRAFVFDYDRVAWHEHVFTEQYALTDILSVLSDEDGSIWLVYSDSAQGTCLGKIVEDQYQPFDWGLDFAFDAGVLEIVKRAKTLYIAVDDSDSTASVVISDGIGSTNISKEIGAGATAKISVSGRGRVINGEVRIANSGSATCPILNEVGLVYKAKKLK